LEVAFRLFRRDIQNFDEHSTVPFRSGLIKAHSYGTVVFEPECSPEVQQRVLALVERTGDSLASLIGSALPRRPLLTLVTQQAGIYGLIGRINDGYAKPIVWRTERRDAENVWHHAHESLEMDLLAIGRHLPRWFIEGMAQLAGFHTTDAVLPGQANELVSTYQGQGIAALHDFLRWATPPAQLSNVLDQDFNRVLAQIIDFANVHHMTKKPLYGAAIEYLRKWTGGNRDAFRKLIRAIPTFTGDDPLVLLRQLFGSLEGLDDLGQ